MGTDPQLLEEVVLNWTDLTGAKTGATALGSNKFYKAQILIRMFDDPTLAGHLPRTFGVFYETERACYEDAMKMQIDEVIAQKGKGDLDKLLRGRETWTIS